MSYSIRVQERPPLIRVALRGFWSMSTFEAYMHECNRAIGGLMARHGRFDTLADCTEFPVQGPEVSAAFEQLKKLSDLTPQNRIAIFTSSALGRLQAERLVGNSHSRAFGSEADATAWLSLDLPPPAVDPYPSQASGSAPDTSARHART